MVDMTAHGNTMCLRYIVTWAAGWCVTLCIITWEYNRTPCEYRAVTHSHDVSNILVQWNTKYVQCYMVIIQYLRLEGLDAEAHGHMGCSDNFVTVLHRGHSATLLLLLVGQLHPAGVEHLHGVRQLVLGVRGV